LPAYEATYMADFTDEASVVEFTGERVHLIDGEQQNIKITGPMDLLVAQEYLRTLKS
jgi:2-C-methyl-D-erythritol 4-phosphate cytidylyltransferase